MTGYRSENSKSLNDAKYFLATTGHAGGAFQSRFGQHWRLGLDHRAGNGLFPLNKTQKTGLLSEMVLFWWPCCTLLHLCYQGLSLRDILRPF